MRQDEQQICGITSFEPGEERENRAGKPDKRHRGVPCI